MSPNLVLADPTQDELTHIWTATHPSWGPALSLQGYLDRETAHGDIPLARDGSLSRWILTDEPSARLGRPVLSSCEVLEKRALVRGAGGEAVKEVTVHGLASVFTDEEHRRKGYAGLMLDKLAGELEERSGGDTHFSVLYSDIGKVYYAKLGWKSFESNHLEFPATPASSSPASFSGDLKPITADLLPSLAQADQALLHKTLTNAPPSQKTLVAILPSLDQFQWHAAREAFQCQHILGRTPTTHGVLYTTPTSFSSTTSRVWALWKRNHSSGPQQPENNTLFVTRFVVENEESISDEELGVAIDAVLSATREEAYEWGCGKVEMWNPSDRVRRLVEKNEKLQAKYVVREQDSITALRWSGEGSADDVEWIANEKYAWC